MSLDLILPHLREIEHLITDDTVSEVMCNSNGTVFIERDGELSTVNNAYPPNMLFACQTIARLLRDEASRQNPVVDARLPDGSRVAIVLPPVSIGGPTLTIRKFGRRQFSFIELRELGTISAANYRVLLDAVENRRNILISGGTGTGKTTLLNALIGLIPARERLVIIEDTVEISATHPNVVRLEARKAQPGVAAVTIRDLVKASLRQRPDRLIVGEVRGAEAFDLLDAMNTGHEGTISTIHANSAMAALGRLGSLCLCADVQKPFLAVQANIGDMVNLVVHIERRKGQRLVTQILNVERFDPATGTYRTSIPSEGDCNA